MVDTTENQEAQFSRPTRKHFPQAALAAVLLLLSACTVGPDYVRPDVPVPQGWETGAPDVRASRTAAVGRWWDHFGDPELSAQGRQRALRVHQVIVPAMPGRGGK